MAAEWKDITSHSRHETDSTPRTWTIKLGTAQLTVTRHIHYPDTWVMQCAFIHSQEVDLETNDLDEAKQSAIRMVHNAARGVILDIEAMDSEK